jgi:hypothetical protein
MTEVPAHPVSGVPTVDIAHIEIELHRVPGSQDLELLARYALKVGAGTRRVVLWDPGFLEIATIAGAMPSRVDHGWKRDTHDNIVEAIILTPTEQPLADGAQISVAARWSRTSRERLNGSSVCTVPALLPIVATGYDEFDASAFPPDASARRAPHLLLRSTLDSPAGRVMNNDGNPTMIAIHTSAIPSPPVWHADDRLVLLGDVLNAQPRKVRDALRDVILEMHTFFGKAYGNQHLVRALVVAEANAYDYVRRPGQYCALDGRLTRQTRDGRFPADRLIARDLASLWWMQGLRFVGMHGQSLGLGLAMAAVMHWLHSTGRDEALSSEIELADRLIAAGETTVAHKAGATAETEGAYAAQVALAIHNASIAGTRIHAELHRLGAELWGCLVPASTIVHRLAKMGIGLPPYPGEQRRIRLARRE